MRKGSNHTEEAKKKISKSRKKNLISNLGIYAKKGSKRSEDWKQKMEEWRRIHRDALVGGGRLGAQKRWEGHIAKPRKAKQGLWSRSFEPKIQLEKRRFRNQRYKTKKRNALGNHTFEDWLALKEFYGNICLCCKRTEPEIKLTEDHIIPLDRGGSDYIENIQPLCVNCNTRKRTKTIDYREGVD